ncbi:MAG: thioredoxin family protein [Patescibacteria group bacterium]
MKNTTIVLLLTIAALLFGGGIYYFSQRQSEETMMPKEDVMMKEEQKNDSTMTNDAAMMEKGRYVTYTPAVFEELANKKRILYFYANWCPTCIPADKNFQEQQAQIPEDITLIRINYNDPDTDEQEKALAKEYGITYQHTFVQLDEQGNVVTKWNGGQIEELLSNIK